MKTTFVCWVLVVTFGSAQGFRPATTTRTTTTAAVIRRNTYSSGPLPTTVGTRTAASSKNNLRYSTQQQQQQRQYRFTAIAATTKASETAATTTTAFDDQCDVLVLGSGPAARSIAALLSAPQNNLGVILSDQRVDTEWPPNYGVWQDEWQAVVDRYQHAGIRLQGGKVGQAIDREWSVTDCYFGGSFDIPTEERMRLERPYCRVDRHALRKTLTPSSTTSSNSDAKYHILKANHISQAVNVNVYTPANTLVHDADGTTIQLQTSDDKTLTVRTKLIVDCTGHETKLIVRESRDHSLPPGFQIAYGVLVDIDESNSPDLTHVGPYDKEAMTLFDYRTDHFDPNDGPLQEKVSKSPTFMYAMPLYDNKVFFEETSLVGRPAVSFQECKDRCLQRLKHLGIRVTAVHEEEFCYIPMGGALPARDQRIIALGGAATMVHPSTGYHLCRGMMGAADVAQVIVNELNNSATPNLDRAAASSYHALWTPENIRQRSFAVFGGEFLMKQNVVGLRGFFDGFFRLPLPLWAGFLAGWPGLPNNNNHESWLARMWFGLSFIVRLPPPVAWDMFASICSYTVTEGVPLLQSVTPFLGAPQSYEYKPKTHAVGDVAAKQEARRMIQASKVVPDLPNSFEGSMGTVQVDGVGKTDVTQEFVAATKDAVPPSVTKDESSTPFAISESSTTSELSEPVISPVKLEEPVKEPEPVE